MLSKVLIVDDSVAIHQTYKITLAKYKCSVLTALGGQEGLNLLASNPDVDLFIVDMYMPRISGAEFIKKVKEQEAYQNIPIIAVISKGQGEESGEAVQLAEGILTKPLTSTDIHEAIDSLFPQAVLESKT